MANTLAAKIAAASIKVGALATDKINTSQNYKYISADKILERAGDALAEVGIIVLPAITQESVQEMTYTDNYGKTKTRYDASVAFDMLVSDGESELKATWAGRGSDFAVPDKAMYKAITSGHKYFLAKLLNIGVGNEDGEHEAAEEAQPTRTRQPQPARPPAVQRKPEPAPAPAAAPANPFDDSTPYFVHTLNRLTGKAHDLVVWTAGLHDKSDGPCSTKQYGLLAGVVDGLTAKRHNYTLSVLCQSEISSSNMPGAKVVEALLKILPATSGKDENGNPVANADHRADIAALVTAIAETEQPQLIAA